MSNIDVTPGTGKTVATDTISTVEHQLVKMEYGAAGSATQVSATSGLPIQGTQSAVSSTSWTSATALNTANSISVTGMNTVTVAIVPTTTFTGGVITFEASPDNTNWFTISMARIDSFTTETTYTIVASTNRAWSTSVDGFTNFRVRLSTVITGTGTLTTLVTAQTMPIEPVVTVGQSNAANLQATVDTELPSAAALADGGSPTQSVPNVGSVMLTASAGASTVDRVRSVGNGSNTAGTGILATGLLAQLDDVSPTAITENQFGNVRMTANRALLSSAKPDTLGGLTTHTLISAATTNATSVKASAGQIYSIQASNTGAGVAFLKIYNKASAPTVGTDTAVKTLIIPAGGGIVYSAADIGVALGTGIAYAITGVATTADTTAVALAQVVVNIDYV